MTSRAQDATSRNPYDVDPARAAGTRAGGLFGAIGCAALLAVMAVVCIGTIWLLSRASV